MSGILPLNVQVNADLTDATNKVVDTVVKPIQGIHKAIVKIFTACAGKWFANKDRQVELIAAQTEKDIEDVKAGRKEYRNGELISLDLVNNPDAFYKQISENNAACDAKRLGAAMLEAAIELSNIPEEEISDEPLNQTFFNHWRAEAELIDEEDLRKFWAHLLVEETKKPNSISPRTLDVAKNLSKDEARRFERFSRYCFDDTIIVNSDDIPICGEYSEILSLQDAGIIGQISNRWYKSIDLDDTLAKQILMFIPGQNYMLSASSNKISFRCHILTVAGRQLLSTLHKKINIENIKIIAKEISRQNNSIEIKLTETIPGKPLFYNSPIWTTSEQ